MSSSGKYIDCTPEMQAEGKLFKSVENIGDTLRTYSIEEAASNLLNLKCKQLHKNEQEKNLKPAQFSPMEGVKELLSPELRKSRFIAFKEKFSEDMYFKKPELGKALALPSTPKEFTNENFIYGLKHKTTEKLYELVLPNKTTEEVEQDFMKWHHKYLISHKHYLPAERVQRNYNEHFKPDMVYGISTAADKTGQKLKKCLQLCDRMVVINKTQKKWEAHKVGCNNLDLLNERTFGIQSNQNSFNVKALIENVEPCTEKTEITEALTHINNLRRHLFNRSDFNMNELRTILKIADEKDAGYIKFSIILKLLRSLQIYANEQKLRALLLHFQMFKDGNEITELVSVEEFWKLLHIQYPLPQKTNSTQPNKICANTIPTTYRSLCSDRDKPIIGPQNTPRPVIVYDLATAGDLITPDAAMRYNLSPQDFQVLRPKEEMCIIFKHLLSPNFEQVWQFACTKKDAENSCKMSVNEFKIYLDEYQRQLQ